MYCIDLHLYSKRSDYASGRFIIGLRDDLENEDSDDEQAESAKADQPHEAKSANRRTLLRTLHLRMTDPTAVSDDEGMLRAQKIANPSAD